MARDRTWELKRRDAMLNMSFREDPFAPAADPRFLYLSAQHADVLLRAQNVIETSRGLAIVEGPIGVGKSTIARRLESIYRANPDENVVVYAHTSTYPSEFAALVDICNQLGLERRKGLTQQWREMESYLVSMMKKEKMVVFILDDAQKMEPDALGLVHTLYNFDVNKKLAQVILFGQPEIRNLIESRPEVANRVYTWLTLNSLSLADSIELIRFRCKVAGRDYPILSQGSLLLVSQITRGIPRDIVNLCSLIIDEITRTGRNPGVALIEDEIVLAAIEIFKKAVSARPDQPTLFNGE